MSETDVATERITHSAIFSPQFYPTVLFSSSASQGGNSNDEPQSRSLSSELVPTHRSSASGQTAGASTGRELAATTPLNHDEIIITTTESIGQTTREEGRGVEGMIVAGITNNWNGQVPGEGRGALSDTMLESSCQILDPHHDSLVRTRVAVPAWVEEEEYCTSEGQVVVLWSSSSEEDLYTHPSFYSPQQTK
ncbi:hypothetical protein Pcinc_016389 [Petrolisthes cinctipes]|uniref:Uncharacterized protein n=1 Tax=Petrolisthes cinctipes TaxID=88211 RepID=A0AAE1FSY9_PETCI|nr:hypothetical protein Pcinc_016389 [Petrolisthes cinctipes]